MSNLEKNLLKIRNSILVFVLINILMMLLFLTYYFKTLLSKIFFLLIIDLSARINIIKSFTTWIRTFIYGYRTLLLISNSWTVKVQIFFCFLMLFILRKHLVKGAHHLQNFQFIFTFNLLNWIYAIQAVFEILNLHTLPKATVKILLY